jgi:hypothetical protein
MYQSHAGVYGPNKPSSQMSTGAWLFRSASRVGSGEKLGTDPRITQADGCIGRPFSREQWTCSNLLTIVQKVAICGPHEIRIVLDHMRIERGKRVAYWSGFSLQDVHRFESP